MLSCLPVAAFILALHMISSHMYDMRLDAYMYRYDHKRDGRKNNELNTDGA